MSNQIIGNTEYNSIKEKAYINGTQENLMQLAAELDKAGINYSGRISDYRSAITVETADRARTLEIMKGILNTAKENVPEDNSEKNIIGNAEYRYISNKRYIRGETEAMLRTTDRLTAENISFSGRIKGDTVTLTVSGDETQELVKRYFAEEKNRIENVQSAYFLALSSDTFEDGYYISEVNVTTGEEIAPYRSSFGDISMFVSVDSAVRYAEGVDITFSNTDEQLNEWRRIEAEAEAEKERQLNLSRSREIIKRLPMTENGEYEEHFVLREDAIDWIYFNPDGADGEGQFVQTSLYADDFIAAYNARSNTENYNKFGQSAFIEAIQNGKQTIINADTEEFERLADIFIKSRGNENVIVSAPLVTGNKYDSNFERIINLLENHFEDVRKYKENHITEASENISVEGHIGTWYVIAAEEIEGRKLFLLEHEKYGDESANIIIDENKNLVMEDVWNGFDDYRDSLEYDDGKQYVSRDFAVELWQNGFTVFMNDRSNELTSRKKDPKVFDLFLDENNNNFYAFNNDIVQQRLLDDTVTLLDGLNDAAIIEAGENNKQIDTAENYARNMFDDGECAYRWNDGITEWQNISASILSGNTEYLYAWLNDLPLELPYIEENRDVSIKSALNYLDSYEKEYMGKLSIDELKKGTRLVYNNTNWEVTHVNYNILALKNLDSNNEMSSTIIERWQNVVTRNKVKFVDRKENSPVGKYVPDESLPLSKQLHELAKRELADYENSLDTAEKAKAAAYELSVKRDILSYIKYDLAEDITDLDVETACRRLISTGYPLNTFYQDWLKNEYDNRMEAIRMTAADTFRKEIPQKEYRLKADTKDYVLDGQEGTWSVVNSAEIDGRQLFELESDNYGYTPEVGHIIADVDGNILAENVHNGFENFYSAEKSPMGNTDKNLEFTVVTFEDGSVYVEAGKIDDNNITTTAAYAEMLKDNFDPNNIKDLDDNIKVEYAVYHTGDGEVVMPTSEELAEIRNNLDNFIGEKEPAFSEESYLHPWKEADDILFDLDKYWQDKSDFNNTFKYQAEENLYIVPTENLSPIAVTEGGIRHYDTLSAVTRIKLKGSDWLDTFDAAVEMNRRGINLDDVEMLRATLSFESGNYFQKDITPEQFAAYSKKIEDEPQKYENIIYDYKKFKAEKEKGLAQAQEDLEDNLAEVLSHSVAHDELEDMSEKIFTDNIEKKIEVAKYYMNGGFMYDSKVGIDTKTSDNDVCFSLENGFEITYSWSDIASAYEQAAINEMEWYYTSGRVMEVYNEALEKDTIISGNLDVQLDRSVFTDWVSNIIARQNSVKTAYESNDKAMFEGTVRREVDIYFYMLCEKSESIGGYNLKDISDFVNAFCGSSGLRKDIYAVVTENVDISLGVMEKARETAHNAGLPFREAVTDPEEEFNPYAFDGTMSPEDYELMHKLMREDSFEIYQVKSGEEYHDKRFAGLSGLSGAPNVADYDLVFSGKLSEIDVNTENKNEILESIFTKFNIDRPEDFKGHSLSVSDVVVLHKDDTDTAHYIDSLGFKNVPEFLKGKDKNLFNEEVFYRSIKYHISETWNEQYRYNVHIFTQGENGDYFYSGNGRFCKTLDEARAFISQDISEREKNSFDIPTNSPVGKPMLKDGDLITLADRDGVWKVSAITDIQIEFENTDPNSPEKSFSRIDFGQHRENLQEILRYELVPDKAVAEDKKDLAVQNAFQRLKDNHDFSPEVVKLLERVEKHIITYNEENFNSKIFGLPLFQQTYGSVSRVNEKLFGGELRSVIDEVNGYIFEEQLPNKELFSESDLSTLREIKVEHDRSNAEEAEKERTLEKAKQLINDFCNREYGSTGDFSDLHNVSLAYTTLTDDELPIQVTADLVDFKITFELNGEKYNEEKYNSLEDLIDYELSNLDFDELVYVPDRVLEKYMSGDKSNELINDFSEAVEKALKTVSNQYNSFLLVQDVVYSLRDLQDGYADDYDWKNYAEAFKNVLDSNVHTEIALPLYKSEAYEILLAAAERKEISADDIAKALKNLELVLQNSHLLKNPEEKVEQISFFDSTPSRKSSDEIGYVSEVPQSEKEPSPVGNDETQKSEKSFAEQVDESLNGTLNPFTTIKICDTPQILLDIGCEQLPMLYTQRHLKNAVKPLDDKEHQHGLTVDQIKKLPELLEVPVMVFDSISKKDSLVVVTSEFDTNDNPVVVSVKPNGKGRYEVEKINSNFVTSVYGRNNFIDFFKRTMEQDSILYVNKNKSQEMFERWGEQYSELTNNLDSDIIIHQSKNIVNTQKQKNNDYTITDKNYGTEGGAKARFANNVAAIKLLKILEKENRTATPEEQEVLAKYVGWGGIANAFDSRKPDWSKEYNELKGLLTDEEYRAARTSTMNAHYTTPMVIKAIYSGLENLGFKGGKILEPAMGIGNFFGAMPENIRTNSDLHGVELDSITGRIAQQLYPSANIQIKGYEDTSFENGSFDVAVGNIPFGDYKLNDKDYNKQKFFIHNYFFAKTLDKVRPGGIVAFVTSKGTLDKESPEVRKYLAERAVLLGAIRLPNNAFRANAGTEVTSDIIFLQKRERPISIEEDTPEWVYKDMLPNGIAVNKYFADHPEMILGEMVEGNKLYGNQTNASMCIPIEGADLEKQLAEAVKNITGEYKAAEKEIEKSPVGNTDEIPCPPNAPKYSFIVQDDILYYHKASDTMEKYNAPETSIEKIKAMAQLRDSVHKLLDLQLDNANGSLDTAISEAQAALNRQYDDFTAKYGLISNAENKMLFRNDNSYHLIKSLEKLDKDGNFIGKADIFSKITVNPNVVVDHCDNAQDALILSLSEKMCVNLEYMSILTGKSEEEIVSELGDKIFQNPQKHMRWESADEYLTGNIRSKLAAAEAAGLTRNAEALRAVMPERIEAADIAVKLGSAWIDPDYIRQFIVETLKPDYITSKNIEVTYMPATDKWKVEGWRSAYENVLATETYGTFDMNAYEIIEATLNMQKAEIRQRVKDERGNDLRDSKGRYVYETNPQKTMIVQAKQDELKRKFADWIFADPDRREKLVDVYNEKFNSVRLREYDGSHLNFVGMSSAITLKEHQKNAVARGLYSNGNTLLAHEVGAGKTFEMIAIAMEGKRLGLHNKSLITAPNGLTEQWGNAFRTLYPNANVLVATEKDFQKENRRDLFAKIATGDWDAVIIGHSQFDMIHLSRERELDVLHTELDRLEEALREMDDGMGRKSFSVKQIEKAIKTYEDKIEKLLAKAPEDDMLCFEKLGIDKIFVDESQAYKNLDTPTKMRNVSGIGSGGSGRSMQLLMKCKYLDELTGGKGTVFASGTPISNSMSEMYTLMRYLQADKLAELGINSFDRWASVFGETTTSMELSPEGNGKYQMKTRFAKFQNLPELMNIFKECADIKTADTLNLDRPDFEMHNVNVPATAIQATMIKELGERAKEIRAGHVDATVDNMCKLTVDGRKIGLDQRCMNPNLPDDPKSKVNVCINNVFDIWQRTAEEKSTQLIFCDLATPQPTLNENTYTVYRKNTKGGYSDVYSAKLGEKDTAEKIMKKLNGKKPPKNYEAGDVADGDIIMLKRVNYEEETAYITAFEVVDGKLTEIAPETWEKLHHTPVEQFESERKFCVYDNIKQKLIAKGVPEKEIAFIHDVDKAEEKQKLYDKMNKGEIRVLIGSTFKCGAGMNAQERMIALHDLDAPMRPSDMEQRHGRIIRQGNTNSKVDIYRYTTDKTFDAYLYQMLENKQRFISQIMTDKSPVRSCEDVDEVALDYAEVKALCAGNPLIREKIDLETEITKLNVLKSAFLSQKYSLQDKAYKSLPEHRKYTEHYIEKLKADIETVQSIKPFVNEDGKNYYPVTVGGKEYHNKEEAGQAIRQAIVNSSEMTEKKQCTIGSYRGFEMTAFMDTDCGLTKMKINLKGACDHDCEINMNNDVKASGNIIRLDNVINGMELELQKQEDKLQSLNADIKEAEIAAEAVFPQEQELIQKEKRLAEVNTLLTDSEIQTDNSMELYAALVEICPELEQYDNLSCKYEKGEDSGIEPLIVEKCGDTVFIAHTYVQNGDLMYDPAIEFSFDTKNHRAEALSYELSGMGIYENFRDGERPDQKADVEEMALDVLFENIKAYGYERTKFSVDDDRETEKEIRDDFAR